MENQPTKLDKAVKISIIFGALIIALSVAYYLIIFLPQKTKSILNQQNQEQTEKEQKTKELKNEATLNLEKCLSDVEASIKKTTISYCKANSKNLQPDGTCPLMQDMHNYFDKKKIDESDLCFKKYPQN